MARPPNNFRFWVFTALAFVVAVVAIVIFGIMR